MCPRLQLSSRPLRVEPPAPYVRVHLERKSDDGKHKTYTQARLNLDDSGDRTVCFPCRLPLTVWRKMRVRRDIIENWRNIHKYRLRSMYTRYYVHQVLQCYTHVGGAYLIGPTVHTNTYLVYIYRFLLLRGTIVNRTYGIHTKLYV